MNRFWNKPSSAAHLPCSWLPRVLLLLLLLPIGARVDQSVSAATPVASEATPVFPEPLAASVAWLVRQQTNEGGFPGFDGEPDPGVTTDAVLALRAAELAGIGSGDAIIHAVLWLQINGGDYAAAGPGQAAKLTLAAVAGGQDPANFTGLDLVTAMQQPVPGTPSPIVGAYGDDLYDHALVMLALAAAGAPVPDTAINVLHQTVNEAGGWAFDGSTAAGAADSNTTALVIQALVANGRVEDSLVAEGLAALRAFQAPDGGFAFQVSDPLTPDANSTALAMQAILAAGENPAGPEWKNATSALAAFAAPDGGFRYLATDEASNLFATVQAIPALAGEPFPIACVGATDNGTPTAAALEDLAETIRENGLPDDADRPGADSVRIVFLSICPDAQPAIAANT